MLIDPRHILGNHITEDIFSDLDINKLEAIPPQAMHRPVDLLFLGAHQEGGLSALQWSELASDHVRLLRRFHSTRSRDTID